MSKTKTKVITIKPRNQWVLVKVEEKQDRTESGLYIPDSVEKEQKSIGAVIDVGPEVTDLKKGERVLFGKFAGESIQLETSEKKDQIDLILLLQEDILAVLE